MDMTPGLTAYWQEQLEHNKAKKHHVVQIKKTEKVIKIWNIWLCGVKIKLLVNLIPSHQMGLLWPLQQFYNPRHSLHCSWNYWCWARGLQVSTGSSHLYKFTWSFQTMAGEFMRNDGQWSYCHSNWEDSQAYYEFMTVWPSWNLAS